MRFLISGYAFRTVDNFLPLLEALSARGHQIACSFYIHLSARRNLELKHFPFPVLDCRTFSCAEDLPSAELESSLKRALASFEPDAVIIDDMLNYPSNAIHAIVQRLRPGVSVLAFQHGFFQFWSSYRRRFACDYFLAFGERDRREFPEALQGRVVALGLPKLQRIRGLPTSDDGSILFVGQDQPGWDVVGLALSEYAAASGRKVRVRLHPQHRTYAPLASMGFEVLEADDDILPHLARCHAIVTTGSTAGFEALSLGKPVVSLPSYSSVVFRDSPCVAYGFKGTDIARVIDSWPECDSWLEEFLSEAVSPLSWDMDASASVVEEICKHPGADLSQLVPRRTYLVGRASAGCGGHVAEPAAIHRTGQTLALSRPGWRDLTYDAEQQRPMDLSRASLLLVCELAGAPCSMRLAVGTSPGEDPYRDCAEHRVSLRRGLNWFVLQPGAFRVLRGGPDFSRVLRIAFGGDAEGAVVRVWLLDETGRNLLAETRQPRRWRLPGWLRS